MPHADEFLDNVEEQDEQRKKFRRFSEDHKENFYGYYPEDFNLRNGKFSSTALENFFIGWCMAKKAARSDGGFSRLGYVKTKIDQHGRPYVTSFSAIPLDGHKPVRLDD
jgi:hypothetical protein